MNPVLTQASFLTRLSLQPESGSPLVFVLEKNAGSTL